MRLRRLAIALLVTPLLAAVPAPAAADKPIESEYTSTFVGWNPCTGEPNDVTINAVAYDHFHNSTFVSPGKWISGSTSDGYDLDKAHDHFLDNGNHFMIKRVSFWENDDEGLKYRIVFNFKQTSDGVQEFRVNFKCYGASTILP